MSDADEGSYQTLPNRYIPICEESLPRESRKKNPLGLMSGKDTRPKSSQEQNWNYHWNAHDEKQTPKECQPRQILSYG